MTEKPFVGLTLARLLRPWGRRGEVASQILTDNPERLTKLREAWLWDGRKPPRLVAIQSCRIHLGQALFHFTGIDSINDAELLRGLELQIPLEKRARLSRGRHYIDDLIGCEVWEQGAPAPLGAVREVQNAGEYAGGATPQSWILSVQTPEGEVLIPMAEEICTNIDTAARRIEVLLPLGLRELNLTASKAAQYVPPQSNAAKASGAPPSEPGEHTSKPVPPPDNSPQDEASTLPGKSHANLPPELV